MFSADEITPASLAGWAYDPAGPVLLDLHVNDMHFATTLANGFRPDLKAADIGDGLVGYNFLLKEPGLSHGDAVRVSNASTGVILFEKIFEAQTDASSVAAVYKFARDCRAPFTKPFWRARPEGFASEHIYLVGELYTPAGYSGGIEPAAPGGSVTVYAADSSNANRYWWMDGDVRILTVDMRPGDRRVIVEAPGYALGERCLNFGAIPAVADLRQFVFAGAERARRVAGGDDTLAPFAGGGLIAALQMLRLAEWHGKVPDRARVLDWGCGAARVLQFLKRERPDWRISGVDVDAVNIRWCQEALSSISDFDMAPFHPPLDFERGSFDFVYGLSVITHLTEETRAEWIEELGRIVRPDGLCVLTYMSPFHILQAGVDRTTLSILDDLASRGISDRLPDPALGDELQSYYRATYCTFENISNAVSPWFEIVGHYLSGALYQDTLVLRRR